MDTLLALVFTDSLTRLVFWPVLACLPLLFVRKDATRVVKIYTLVVALVELAFAVRYAGLHLRDGVFVAASDGVFPWIASLGIDYHLVADGISMPLVLLSAFLLPLVVIGTWNGIERHWRTYAMAMLLLTSGVLGTFLAQDLFLFYVFFEVSLVPMYLIIGIWGGERRIYAAVKFFLYTMAGSLLMLVALLWLAWTYAGLNGGEWSFAYADLLRLDLPLSSQIWVFAAFAIAFAIKVPMVPVHTWLPDAHVQAPTGGSVLLAGVLLKLGTYGFLRFALPLFPDAAIEAQPVLLTLAVIGILYGALVAWVQDDMKKLVAYSSVAHLGFVMLGLLAPDLYAWQGSLLQMVNHGLSTGALFFLVGMLYERRHTKKFEDFGGLAKVMPLFAFFLVFSALASMGLPALNGFVGEFMILVGSYRALGLWAVAGAFGVVLAAIYLLRMLDLTLWGPLTRDENKNLSDLSVREVVTLVPLCVFMLWIGVAPQPFLEPSRPALEATLAHFQERVEAEPVTRPTLRDATSVAAFVVPAAAVAEDATAPPPTTPDDPAPPTAPTLADAALDEVSR